MPKTGRAQNTVNRRNFLALPGGQRQGAQPLSPTERRETPFGYATARGPWPDLSAYARQPARGPTMLAHLVAMLGYVGLMLTHVEPKDPKMGREKKHCKTQDILMVGGLSWGYVGPSWGYVGLSWGYVGPSRGYLGPSWGLCWPILGAMLAHLGAILAILGAMLAHLGGYVGPS